jgi:hypothetical protein
MCQLKICSDLPPSAGGSLDAPEAVRPIEQFGIESELSWISGLRALPAKRIGKDGKLPSSRRAPMSIVMPLSGGLPIK